MKMFSSRIAMMGKPKGGFRAIAILASAYRLWAAVRVGAVRTGAADYPLSDDARPGIGAKRAAYKRRTAQEVAALMGKPWLGIYIVLAISTTPSQSRP